MATTTVGMPDPAPQPQQKIGNLGRILGVLFSPKATFEDIVQKPTWVLPVVVFVVLSLLGSVIFVQRVDWRDVISQQMEKDPRAAQLSAEQKEQRIEMGAKFAPVFHYNPVAALVMAMRNILLKGISPGEPLIIKLCAVSLISLAVGFYSFQRLKPRFYDHL